MALAPGSRLGPYEIVALLGAGGMGEVYRARDPRLGRDVAVKVLGANAAATPDRLRRFEDEARALGALNHPNILSVLDVGSENESPYVVFELLEGLTLGDRLRRGPLPPRKAVEHVVQVCHGLAAAHAKGIVHRDLKPSNLFLTSGGRVKILDFGLAKLSERLTPEEDLENSRTRSTASGHGAVLGTVGYMSPEQVRGRPADARSDLFSLGAILNHEPPEITGPAKSFPPALGRIVHRCLEKDPEEHFQSARDLAFALEALSPGGRASRRTERPSSTARTGMASRPSSSRLDSRARSRVRSACPRRGCWRSPRVANWRSS
jgi:serine/threonine protein kinase